MEKRSRRILTAAAVLIVLLVLCVEPFPWSGSAAADLTEAMEAIHGTPYSGRVLSPPDENGRAVSLREDLGYSVEAGQPFVLRSWLAAPLGINREYICQAVFTRYRVDESEAVLESARQVWTYPGLDDGDPGSSVRAWLMVENAVCAYPDGETLFDPALIP